ncbi:MAG: hypothetical protein ACK4N5_06820 [Myxococcales bacterium]
MITAALLEANTPDAQKKRDEVNRAFEKYRSAVAGLDGAKRRVRVVEKEERVAARHLGQATTGAIVMLRAGGERLNAMLPSGIDAPRLDAAERARLIEKTFGSTEGVEAIVSGVRSTRCSYFSKLRELVGVTRACDEADDVLYVAEVELVSELNDAVMHVRLKTPRGSAAHVRIGQKPSARRRVQARKSRPETPPGS